ncbi:MAG: hypothetical protein RMZ43_002940 [Nostoc sp. CmiVER01]|uniref:hypothetical protein n=1 Tax=Nostoc sp. CmiVER01 TaxID=3075384 RepID=UPI002AD4D461|nr:hypothetical protein [Nostoc sp. CmiVER01]MDZ8124755.1 hypothetical protein [Nostoc sp. CmiVER01]
MAIELTPDKVTNDTINVNGLSVIWEGNWSSTKTYRKNLAVSYLGSSYRANKTTTQVPSLGSVDWDILALGGSGKLIQAVYAEYSTEAIITNGTLTNTGLSVTITPTSITNSLYFYILLNGIVKSSSATSDNIYLAGIGIYNNTTSAYVYTSNIESGRFTTTYCPPISINCKTAITSIFPTTYLIRASSVGANIKFQSGGAYTSSVIVQEVAP